MLILASTSPRRKDLLLASGIPFKVRAPQIEEIRASGEPAEQYVRRLARDKASAVQMLDDEVILGADTVIALGSSVLEKPRDRDDARSMIAALSGQLHTVMTGICLRWPQGIWGRVIQTKVQFAYLTDGEIEEYASSGEGMDKAGGWAIQGLGSKFVDRIEGCYFNVMGLPISSVYQGLKEIGKL